MTSQSRPIDSPNMIRPIPKPQRIRDPDYLAHIRTMECLLADRVDECDGFTYRSRVTTEAAHVRGKGAGGGDEQVIPLCGKHHRWGPDSLHKLNVAAFDKFWGISVKKIARALRREYLTGVKP